MRRTSLFVSLALLLVACSTPGKGSSSGSGGAGGAGDAGPADASYDVPVTPPPDGSIQHACDLPGSVQFLQTGTQTVPGGSPTWPSLAFLHLPVGFCAHYF